MFALYLFAAKGEVFDFFYKGFLISDLNLIPYFAIYIKRSTVVFFSFSYLLKSVFNFLHIKVRNLIAHWTVPSFPFFDYRITY